MGDLRNRVLRNAGAREATPGETRTLRLLDRRDRHATAAPTPIEVVVPAACPRCGKARGKPELVQAWDVRSKTEYPLSVWRNPCGHVDLHADVIQEAERFMLGATA